MGEVQPCITSADRTCEINIATGLYIIETEADDNRMCLAMLDGEWYPSRVNYGNGDAFCGAMGDTDDEKKTNLLGQGEAIFRSRTLATRTTRRSSVAVTCTSSRRTLATASSACSLATTARTSTRRSRAARRTRWRTRRTARGPTTGLACRTAASRRTAWTPRKRSLTTATLSGGSPRSS